MAILTLIGAVDGGVGAPFSTFTEAEAVTFNIVST